MAEARQQSVETALLLSIVEQLKRPLLHISYEAETGKDVSASIQASARAALTLLDSYATGLTLTKNSGGVLALEPIVLSSVLYDAAHELDAFAALHGVRLEVHTNQRLTPVMGHHLALKTAFVGLGQACIEAQSIDRTEWPLQLLSYRSQYGAVAGWYGLTDRVGAGMLRRGKQLGSRARAAFPDLTMGSGAGILLADYIFAAMTSELRATKREVKEC